MSQYISGRCLCGAYQCDYTSEIRLSLQCYYRDCDTPSPNATSRLPDVITMLPVCSTILPYLERGDDVFEHSRAEWDQG